MRVGANTLSGLGSSPTGGSTLSLARWTLLLTVLAARAARAGAGRPRRPTCGAMALRSGQQPGLDRYLPGQLGPRARPDCGGQLHDPRLAGQVRELPLGHVRQLHQHPVRPAAEAPAGHPAGLGPPGRAQLGERWATRRALPKRRPVHRLLHLLQPADTPGQRRGVPSARNHRRGQGLAQLGPGHLGQPVAPGRRCLRRPGGPALRRRAPRLAPARRRRAWCSTTTRAPGSTWTATGSRSAMTPRSTVASTRSASTAALSPPPSSADLAAAPDGGSPPALVPDTPPSRRWWRHLAAPGCEGHRAQADNG